MARHIHVSGKSRVERSVDGHSNRCDEDTETSHDCEVDSPRAEIIKDSLRLSITRSWVYEIVADSAD